VCHPLNPAQTLLYLALLYASLARLDKLGEYGQSFGFLIFAQYAFLAGLVLICVFLVIKKTSVHVVIALSVLVVPVSHFPLELIRNVMARYMTDKAYHLYVTKLFLYEIYGLRLAEQGWVDRLARVEGQFKVTNSELTNNGGGTLPAQIPVVSHWEIEVIRAIYGNKSKHFK